MKILVTGASGFVGRALVAQLERVESLSVRAAVRRVPTDGPHGADTVQVGDLGAATDWRAALRDCDVVVHAAARVHAMQETASDPLALYRAVNLDGTLALAQQAADAGARRFVFLSTIKVNGEATQPGRPFRWDDVPAPRDPYGISKAEAEDALRTFAVRSGLEVVIIRPVLVYGPGVKANFRTMLRWVQRGVPLPLARAANRRSLVALENLTDLIRCSVTHPAAADRTFLVSDGEDLSTADLLRRSARAMGRSARLVSLPTSVLHTAARLVGRGALADRLLGTLQVDIADTRRRLGWAPVISVDEALRRTVASLVTLVALVAPAAGA